MQKNRMYFMDFCVNVVNFVPDQAVLAMTLTAGWTSEEHERLNNSFWGRKPTIQAVKFSEDGPLVNKLRCSSRARAGSCPSIAAPGI